MSQLSQNLFKKTFCKYCQNTNNLDFLCHKETADVKKIQDYLNKTKELNAVYASNVCIWFHAA